jgi:NAD(P)-dependent dehydrogenase (short-subunit alcohol dehydrogenase family)
MALVTGATSGLGFEAAAQLAEAGYARVTITGRSSEKAEAARDRLIERTGRDVFETVALDLNTPRSVNAAVAELAEQGQKIDFLLLNAGMVAGNELIKTGEGIEITAASSLIGHHQLTMQLLGQDLLGEQARIVIAGSEAARGDVPTFNPVDLPQLAAEHYDGDLAAAAEALIRHEAPLKYKPATAYSNAKLFVAYWSAELARKLPEGMTVNTVSPGSAPDTDAGRNANFFMRNIMMPFFKLMPGKSATVSEAAGRYLEVAGYSREVSGEFFASAPKKMIGPLHKVELPHVRDRQSQEGTWSAVVEVAGGMDYPVAA